MSVPDTPTFTTAPLVVNNSTVTVEFALGLNGGSDLTDIQYARDTDGYTTWTSLGLSAPLEGYTSATISGLLSTPYGLYKIRSVNAIGNSSPSTAESAYLLNSGNYYVKTLFSSNNQYVIALNDQSTDEAAVSSDGGATWTAVVPPSGDDCYDVAISADGGYMYYVTYPGGGLYQSTDHGATFSQLLNAPSGIVCITCNSTGQKVYCVSDNDGYLYISNDYGANFTQGYSFGGSYVPWIICSASGSYVYTYDDGGSIYASTDSGANFTVTATINNTITYIVCDQSGKNVYISTDTNVNTNVSVYCSLDYGTTFLATSHPNVTCNFISCDSLGNRLITLDNSGVIRVSYDAGTTWTQKSPILGQTPSYTWGGVSISPDGTHYIYSLGAPGTYLNIEGTADVAPIWTEINGVTYHTGKISTNNQNMVAVSDKNGGSESIVAYSSDAGLTWNETVDFGYVYSIVASASCQIVLAMMGDGQVPYLSTDYGATFSITSLSPVGAVPDYYAVMNSSGTSMMTISSDGYVYLSTDSGTTWTNPYQFTNASDISSLCSSASMDRIYLIHQSSIDGSISTYLSTDMGTSWSSISQSPSLSGMNYITCDWSGQKLVLSCYDDGVYRSIDGGVSWTQTTAPTGSVNMAYIVTNSTGNRIVVLDDNSYINYVSIDAGLTWTSLCTPTGISSNYFVPIISPDGSRAISAFPSPGTFFQTLGSADLPTVPCFLEGSKILCKVDGVEQYVAVETIRPGTLVKTSRDGFQPVKLIGSRSMVNVGGDERHKDSLYHCTKANYPELTEDLTITGCHAILVDHITDVQRQGIIKTLERVFVTDKKYRLPACVDERAAVVQTAGTFTVWHFALEHADIKMNYGVYAQGLLVESSPIWHMNTKNYNLVQ